jgi:hypothetical protein
MTTQNLQESSLSRVTKHMTGHAVGMMTAFRAEFTREQNLQRNRSLLAKLLKAGYHVTAVKGDYTENRGSPDAKPVKEESFFVTNPMKGDDHGELQRDLIAFGEEFDQDSIFSKPFGTSGRVIGTSARENAWPGKGGEHAFPQYKPGQEAEFLTRVNGRPFTFGESYSKPTSVMGLWVLNVESELPWESIIITESKLFQPFKVVDNGDATQ